MGNTIKAALITGILGLIATIAAAVIGVSFGKSSEQKNIQNEIHTAMGNVVNIIGNDNQVTINNVKDLIDGYLKLLSQNQSLLDQNSRYFNELTEANNQIAELQSLTNDTPILNYSNLGLSIDAQDIPINKSNSMVSIDGREYFSRELTEKIIPDNQNMTIKDDTLFIGKVIADKANLFDQWISDKGASCYIVQSIKDSYGNVYSNCLLLTCTDITFNTQGKYSLLKCDIAMSEELYKNCNGVLTIKADGNPVYSVELNKLTEPFTEVAIPINNCNLLNISYDTDTAVSNNGCIIANATLYNE